MIWEGKVYLITRFPLHGWNERRYPKTHVERRVLGEFEGWYTSKPRYWLRLMKRPAPLPNLRACQHDEERKRRCCCIHLQARFASSTSRNIRRENIMIGIWNGRMEFNHSRSILYFFFLFLLWSDSLLFYPRRGDVFFLLFVLSFSTGLGMPTNTVYKFSF